MFIIQNWPKASDIGLLSLHVGRINIEESDDAEFQLLGNSGSYGAKLRRA